jgi:hypothetical protein
LRWTTPEAETARLFPPIMTTGRSSFISTGPPVRMGRARLAQKTRKSHYQNDHEKNIHCNPPRPMLSYPPPITNPPKIHIEQRGITQSLSRSSSQKNPIIFSYTSSPGSSLLHALEPSPQKPPLDMDNTNWKGAQREEVNTVVITKPTP